jgi:hypothetical protein
MNEWTLSSNWKSTNQHSHIPHQLCEASVQIKVPWDLNACNDSLDFRNTRSFHLLAHKQTKEEIIFVIDYLIETAIRMLTIIIAIEIRYLRL